MTTLSPEHIEKLYAFTKQHYVPYYDLQTELVDHLANSIENQWKEQPNKSFDNALQTSFKAFGVYGFSELLEKKQAAMNKKYWKLVVKLLKEYITISKIALSLLVVLIMYSIITGVSYKVNVVYGVICTLGALIAYKFLKRKLDQKKRIKAGEKRWLFQEEIDQKGNAFIIVCNIPTWSSFFKEGSLELALNNSYVAMIITIFITALVFITYIIAWVIPAKAKMYIAKEHPEYNLV